MKNNKKFVQFIAELKFNVYNEKTNDAEKRGRKMDVMFLFDIVIMLLGIHMIFAAFKMHKTGEISPVIITPEEIARCRNKSGFIAFMYWKEAVFGGVLTAVGALGVLNDKVISLNAYNVIELLVFLAVFLWFQEELRKARAKFI